MSTVDDIRTAARRMEGFPRPWFVSGGWAIDLFLGAVTRPHADREIGIFLRSPSGIPVLAPEIQLLYKAKWHRPRDEHDFAHAVPRMNPAQREWLRQSLRTVHPDDPWLNRL